MLKFFDDLCKKPTLWGGNLQFNAYASRDLHQNIGTWVAGKVDLMLQDLERLAKSPSLPALAASYTQVMEQYRAFNEKHVPPLREFTRRSESDKLTTFFRKEKLVQGDETVDPDTVQIDFNGRNMSWTDWVLEGYRQHGDNLFAGSNNFMRDAILTSNAPELTARLNASDVKESIERNLRSTYPGERFATSVKALLDPTDPRYREARDLRVAAQMLEMQLALDVEHSRGNVDAADYQWLKSTLDGLPGSITRPDVEFSRFKLSGTRIPGVWVVSRKSSAGRGDSFVFVSEGPYGRMLYKDGPYFQGLIRTDAFRQYFENKALTRDQQNIDQALRGAYSPNYFYTSLEPINDFKAECDQVLRDALSNADEATTSKFEVIVEQVTKGVRYATAAICTGSTAGVGVAACVIGTGALMGVDTYSAIDNLQRGKKDEALLDVAFLWADAIDVGQGVKAFDPKNLLKIVGKAHFSSVDEAKDAIEAASRQRKHFNANGSPTAELSPRNVALGQLAPMQGRPGKAPSGKFYEYRGKTYIVEQGHVFEVYSDNAWSTVRVRNPSHPNATGAPLAYRNGYWQLDDGGLRGGGLGDRKVTSLDKMIGEYMIDELIREKDLLPEELSDAAREAFATELVALTQRSNADEFPHIKEYVEGDRDGYNATIRGGKSTPDTKEFLSEFDSLNDYKGTSYRATYVTPAVAKELKKAKNSLVFSDSGLQSASTQPINVSGWDSWAKESRSTISHSVKAIFIFDTSVPQKNLSSGLLKDHVAVVPNARLKVALAKRDGDTLIVYFVSAGPGRGKTKPIYN